MAQLSHHSMTSSQPRSQHDQPLAGSTRHSRSRRSASWMRAILAIALIVGVLVPTLLAAPARAATCPSSDAIQVPGAEQQKIACLDDLSTAGLLKTGHTVQSDWNGLNAAGAVNPPGVSGLQIDGYFPDTSTFNTFNGWNHDAQFVIRLPNTWNGKLIITGAPGVRRQYSADFIISDWVLARGYAFAATDKGNSGTTFFRDGATPGDAIAEWNQRVTELTIAAKEVVRQRYGKPADYTYITGISNGGYLTRYALENHQELYDGGVDWEGTLFRAEGPNLLTSLPVALKNYPQYVATGSPAAREALIGAGFTAETEFLWQLHYLVYWDFTQRTYREEFDPTFDGALEAGIPFCASGTPSCDTDYDYSSRPQAVKDAVAKVELTGKIKRPMITLHGTLDAFLPASVHSGEYARLVRDAQRERLHRYYVVEDGNHVDSFANFFPTQIRPILPCYRAAFEALETWVEQNPAHRNEPPASGLIARPASGDLANSCALP